MVLADVTQDLEVRRSSWITHVALSPVAKTLTRRRRPREGKSLQQLREARMDLPQQGAQPDNTLISNP